GTHQPGGRHRVRPPVPVLVLEAGGVGGQRVWAGGGSQAGEPADLVRRAGDEGDGDGAREPFGSAVVREGQGGGGEVDEVDRVGEGDIDRRDGGVARVWSDRREGGREGQDGLRQAGRLTRLEVGAAAVDGRD